MSSGLLKFVLCTVPKQLSHSVAAKEGARRGGAGSLPPSNSSSPAPLPHRHAFTSLSTDGTQVSLGACCPSLPGTGRSGLGETGWWGVRMTDGNSLGKVSLRVCRSRSLAGLETWKMGVPGKGQSWVSRRVKNRRGIFGSRLRSTTGKGKPDAMPVLVRYSKMERKVGI